LGALAVVAVASGAAVAADLTEPRVPGGRPGDTAAASGAAAGPGVAEPQGYSGRGGEAVVASGASAAGDVTRSTADVVRTAHEYQAALERVLVFRERDVLRAAAQLDKRRELAARGIVARREVDAAEAALARAREAVDEARLEISRTESVVAEVQAADEAARAAAARARATVVNVPREQYPGGRWSLAGAPAVERFFAERFGRPLPVSAFGQTAVHDRLGFDHRNALDVALDPDSAEGQALVTYLQEHGVPFLVFRGPKPGVSTGAHVHIGEPSRHKS
jgi:hypothetical protein